MVTLQYESANYQERLSNNLSQISGVHEEEDDYAELMI